MIKRNIKIKVTPEESKQVQEICFANGIGWSSKDFTPILLDKEYLMIREVITWDDKERYYIKDLEEVDASLFIRTSGTCVEETPEQELKQNTNKEETMEKNEVESYADVKAYLIAKGLYERVLNQKWRPLENGRTCTPFSFLFTWINTIDGITYWSTIDEELRALGIHTKVESLIQDYKAKQGKEFIKYIEAQPEELVETKPLEKPKQYLCFVQGKELPKHIHKTLEQAKQEAQRLCRKELAKVSVLEVVAEYQAEVLVKEVL